jgi:3-phenylpropionate/trans-cinnamate dioxygenase ferredoxin subunit
MSANFVKVASLEELKISKLMHVHEMQQDICLAYVDGEVYAIDDMCSHEDASLSKGSLHEDCVKCPLHGSRFDLKTGAALDEPAEDPVNTYPVKIDGDDILVAL